MTDLVPAVSFFAAGLLLISPHARVDKILGVLFCVTGILLAIIKIIWKVELP